MPPHTNIVFHQLKCYNHLFKGSSIVTYFFIWIQFRKNYKDFIFHILTSSLPKLYMVALLITDTAGGKTKSIVSNVFRKSA